MDMGDLPHIHVPTFILIYMILPNYVTSFPRCYDGNSYTKISNSYYKEEGSNRSYTGFLHTTAPTQCRKHCKNIARKTFYGIGRNGARGGRVRCFCDDVLTGTVLNTCTFLCGSDGSTACGGSTQNINRLISLYTVCDVGFYGSDCSKSCQGNCDLGLCGLSDGHCHNGCLIGYHGDFCDQVCENCVGSCDQATGACLTECTHGFYGANCDKKCPENCKDGICIKDTGVCYNGCINDMWGEFCNHYCSHCKGGCSPTGICIGGCKPEWKEPTCTCPSSCLGECDNVTGECLEACLPGKWGAYCENNCSNCLDGCSKDSGLCNGSCINNWYGNKCDKNCPKNCGGNVCSQKTGLCIEGCKTGYWGLVCNKLCSRCTGVCSQHDGVCEVDCVTGYWGERCEANCPKTCHNRQCTKKEGKCSSCIADLHGPYCNVTCRGECLHVSCDDNSPTCNFTCREGWIGEQCEHQECDLMPIPFWVPIAIALAAVIGILIGVLIMTFYYRHQYSNAVMQTSTKEEASELPLKHQPPLPQLSMESTGRPMDAMDMDLTNNAYSYVDLLNTHKM